MGGVEPGCGEGALEKGPGLVDDLAGIGVVVLQQGDDEQRPGRIVHGSRVAVEVPQLVGWRGLEVAFVDVFHGADAEHLKRRR
jgi:hypothetical protein